MTNQKISVPELQKKLLDPDISKKDLRPYFILDDERSQAFSPFFCPNPDTVELDGLEGEILIGGFTWLSRIYRRSVYEGRKNDRNSIRVVSEGDSWFQYPILLDDVIDHIIDADKGKYAVLSLGAAGDLLSDIVLEDELSSAIDSENPAFFLISGGGNDILGDRRLKDSLHPFDPAKIAGDYPNQKFQKRLDHIGKLYLDLFQRLTTRHPNLNILFHGYDHVFPKGQRWLGGPMDELNITDANLQREIALVLIDRLNAVFQQAANGLPTVHYIDSRGQNPRKSDWQDELHPKAAGFGRVAALFLEQMQRLLPVHGDPFAGREHLCPGQGASIAGNSPEVDLDTARRTMVRRSRKCLGDRLGEIPLGADLAKLKTGLSDHFEKVHLGSDFQPARFLPDGSEKSMGVCRIKTRMSLGTGFLVATRQYLMTNNHVLPDRKTAETSVAEFGFEEGESITRVSLQPDKFFLTSPDLDFTIVACGPNVPEDIRPIPLLRNPATIATGEGVNIIQHPRGRAKEIAIRNNEVISLKQNVIHYRTDTEPGSSGSPVFNDDWELVALHHAGWMENGKATNEGVRISAIVAHLLARRRNEGFSNSELDNILNEVSDTSPLLGFFDLEGVYPDDPREIEIPHFKGSKDFADIGFWNIEHFNNTVSADRVGRVANVIAKLNMDALGLTEIQEGALQRLVKQLNARGDNMGFVIEDVRGRQDLAVLYDKDTTKVELAKDIVERHKKDLASATSANRSAFPRIPLFARCVIEDGNTTPIEFLMIVVHLKAFGDQQSRARRRLASQILADIIHEVRERDKLPVILGGDFNELMTNDALDALKNAPDLFSLTADDAVSGAASYIGGSRRSLIDHIIISKDLKPGSIQGDDAAIVRLDKSVADFSKNVSDHVPLVMRLIARDFPLDAGDDEPQDNREIEVPENAKSLRIEFQ